MAPCSTAYTSEWIGCSQLSMGLLNYFTCDFRMERLDCRRTSTLAKSIGTIVSISGAFVVTLYKGAVLMTRSSSLSFNNHLLLPVKSNWFLGGLLLAADCVLASAWLILQVIGDLSSLALSLCLFFPFSGNRKPFISSEKCLWC